MGFVHDQLVLAGHSIDYFCSEDSPQALRGRFARFTFPVLVLRHAMAAARAGRPFDLINVHETSGAAVSLLKRAAGKPRVVVTSHGIEERGWQRRLEESRLGRESVRLRSRLLYPVTVLWQARVALSHADHVFCLNMEDCRYLTSTLEIPANKVTRIHSGADIIYSEAGKSRDYSKAETLLFAGTWLKRKGTCDLVPAFDRLAARYPHLKLVVLNGGVSAAAILACFPEPVRPRVVCQQSEPEQAIARAMAATDIYLLPSLFEGTPLTLIEAMFSGMPLVTTATCGMKDVIEHERSGLLVPLRSPDAIVAAVERLLEDSALRARLGQVARAQALEKYSWQRVAEPVRRIYEELCA